jgi:rSAM/selenodomain-associated transferase 1
VSVSAPRGRGECVLVVAKAPEPGRTKTRLCPPLSEVDAAALGRAMLLDTLDCCRQEVADVGILHADPGEAPGLWALAGPRARLVLQRGSGLRDALRSGAEAALAGADAVALVSSDIPGVPPGALGRAFAALAAGADVALGPGLDGGYWLVALREAHPEPFEDIPWSTPRVLATTLERCETAGLAVSLLDEWRDIDTAADLAALLPDLDRLPGRRTAAHLRALAGGGGRRPPNASSSSYERRAPSSLAASSSSHKRPEPRHQLTTPNPQEVSTR